mmetsp:Transcript_7439/g.13009  ORF Transcript_7439/g.13009 Transcript_7439/m.13009 type:complete len:200 (-) Transcript_7439:1-600(-)
MTTSSITDLRSLWLTVSAIVAVSQCCAELSSNSTPYICCLSIFRLGSLGREFVSRKMRSVCCLPPLPDTTTRYSISMRVSPAPITIAVAETDPAVFWGGVWNLHTGRAFDDKVDCRCGDFWTSSGTRETKPLLRNVFPRSNVTVRIKSGFPSTTSTYRTHSLTLQNFPVRSSLASDCGIRRNVLPTTTFTSFSLTVMMS